MMNLVTDTQDASIKVAAIQISRDLSARKASKKEHKVF